MARGGIPVPIHSLNRQHANIPAVSGHFRILTICSPLLGISLPWRPIISGIITVKTDPSNSIKSPTGVKTRPVALILLGALLVVLSLLFFRGWLPGKLIFSNDGPLGAISAQYYDWWPALTGRWADLNWIGLNGGSQTPSISSTFGMILGPVLFSKFYAPFSLFLVGICAWFLFHELKFSKTACIIGGLAAALNSDFLTTACWGVASQPIGFALCYLALGLIVNLQTHPWLRTILAGMAVGMGVIEASDIGAIFSVFVAAWVVAHALFQEGPVIQRIARGGLRLALVAGFAGFIAASAIFSLIGTQVKGVVGMAQDEQTKAARWSEATQWSVPKSEALGIMVPGLFGFRMDTPMFLPSDMQKSHAAGAYWGKGGRDSAWDAYLASDRKGPTPGPGQFLRYGGGGGYAGILVLLVAVWAIVQSFRGEKSFFSAAQRKMLWFWLGVIVLSVALMFGRYAPFYQFFYALPYASTIRNPAKFMHVLEWALIVVFGYGLHGLTTLYLDRATATTRGIGEQFSLWWKQTAGFDKNWVRGTFIALALAGLAWFCYYGMRGKAEAYVADLNQCATLQQGGRPDPVAAAESAAATISFSLKQCGWAFGFLAASVATLAIMVSGGFAGKRARVASIILGLLVVVDLGWQGRPWVIAQNWTGRYVEAAQNPVFDFLRDKPYEHRVGSIDSFYLKAFQLDPRLVDMESLFQSVYGSEWTQHLFPYYNIQSISVVQMPRRPLDYDVFETSLRFYFNTNTIHNVARRWELTNTRYIACATPLVNLLNQAFDPGQHRFKPRIQFDFHQERSGGPILIRTNENGRFAIVEFTGAIPRAKLYSNWESVPYEADKVKAWTDSIRQLYPPGWSLPYDSVSTNDLATLEKLTRPSFDPAQQVLLAAPIQTAPPTNTAPGTVEFVSYAPKEIVLKTRSTATNVLLLNDRYDPNWQVSIDGQPATLLRCNYLMRGVAVPAGEHQVVFAFRPDTKYLYVSLAAIALGICLVGYLAVTGRKSNSNT